MNSPSKQDQNTKSSSFKTQITLAFIFIIFGILIVAQYRTHTAYSDSLESQSYQDLSALALNLMDRKSDLQTELDTLEDELNATEELVNSGLDVAATQEARLNSLHIADGSKDIEGPGITVTITSESSRLIAYDLIDIVNELFVTGAEAVAINNIRINSQSQIIDKDMGYGNFSIVVDDEELLSPVVIKAIGHPSTLETGLVYSGGIIDTLRILQIFPVVKQEELLNIPAANPKNLELASPVDE